MNKINDFIRKHSSRNVDRIRINTVEFVLSHSAFKSYELVMIGDVIHFGRKGQKRGVRNGPPYPLSKEIVTAKYDNKSLKASSFGRPSWTKEEQKEPFDYWSLQDDKTGYPRQLKAKGFSSEDTLGDHYKDHGIEMGYESKEDYQKGAIDFFHSPRGKSGDAHVCENGDACRYDYDTKVFGKMTKDGTIKTFWDLSLDRSADSADKYWEENKKE